MNEIITVQILGAVYSGKRPEKEKMLTHSIFKSEDGGGDGFTLCGRVPTSHTADSNSDPEGINKPPTCKNCLRKDTRFSLSDIK